MGPGALGGPQNRAQIMGVRQLVAQDDQRSFTLFTGVSQDVVNGGIFPGSRHVDDALMGVGHAHGVQLPPVHADHHGPRFLGLLGQPLEAVVHLAAGHEHLIDGPAGAKGLLHGVAALQAALVLLGLGGRFPAVVPTVLPAVEAVLPAVIIFSRLHTMHSVSAGFSQNPILRFRVIIADFPPLDNHFFWNSPFPPGIHRKFTANSGIIHCSRGENVIE